jgi:hypothetical protein
MAIDRISSPLIPPVTPVQSTGFNPEGRAQTPEDLAKRLNMPPPEMSTQKLLELRDAGHTIHKRLTAALRDGKNHHLAYLIVSSL